MGSGFSKMKKQAKLLSDQFNKAQEEIKAKTVIGQAGAGLVQIHMSGEKKVLKVEIKKECVDADDVDALQDLIQAAFHDAEGQLSDASIHPAMPMGLSLPF